MQPNEIAAKARELCAAQPPLAASFKAAWSRVCDKIEARALTKRPKARVFEIHHETELARLALLTAIAEGRSPEAGEAEALARVGFM